MLRKFRNRSEDQMQRQIRAAIIRHGAELHEKVRIADVIDISKLDTRGLGSYALQAHFDFVLIDEKQEAIVAIEFDGLGHDPTNDNKKNSICQQAGLPFFRVYGFEEIREINAMTLTRYLVELVFHARIFLQMQEEGKLASDEAFMLSGFLKHDAKHIFDSEFNFIGNTNGKLTRALREGGLDADALPHLSICRLTLQAPDGRLHAFMCIDSSVGPIFGTASLRVALASWGFLANLGTISAEIAQFVNGMAADSLLENIRLITDGHGHAVTDTDEMLTELKMLRSQGYNLIMGSGSSPIYTDLLAKF